MRIVAGKHKGLNLYDFDANNIRPTTDRVKENIFNKIQFIIPGADVLDLFGGTGAISIEFLSRGAKDVVICDNNKNSISLIKKNYTKAKESLNLYIGDYKDTLHNLKGRVFDIIFLDPPYATNYGQEAIQIICDNDMLSTDGVIVYEHLVDTKFDLPKNMLVFDEKKYGTIAVSFIRRGDD